MNSRSDTCKLLGSEERLEIKFSMPSSYGSVTTVEKQQLNLKWPQAL